MNKTKITLTIAILILFHHFHLNAIPKLSEGKKPKNIIVMISDGCGYNHILSANYYESGSSKYQPYEKFPVVLAMSTYPAKIDQLQWASGYNPDSSWKSIALLKKHYTCSAAAATAMATGVKTYNGAIGVDINQKKIPNVIELAEEMGKSTGVITTVQLSHATPAGFVAHNKQRNNYAEIAKEMILESKCEVIMGCGHPFFDNDGKKLSGASTYKYVGDSIVWHEILKNGKKEFTIDGQNIKVSDADGDEEIDPWTFIDSKSDFIKYIAGETPKRLFGVAPVATTLQQERTVVSGETLPFDTPLLKTVPTLSEMTRAAINVLDNNRLGFFLMIEGGAVDWASHANQSNRMIEEEIDFNEAVKSVIAWVEENSSWEETLVIITSDHECGLLLGPGSDDNNFREVVNHGKGKLPGMEWYHDSHSNSLVPLFAKGSGSELLLNLADESDPVRGKYITNSEIAILIQWLWKY